jgi:hypothetical protein
MTHKRSPKGQEKQTKRFTLYESEQERRFFHTMKQKDIAHAIVKDHSERDLLTGEVMFNPKQTKKIQNILLGATFRFEEQDDIQPEESLAKHVGARTHYEWHRLDYAAIERALVHSDSEVLNRAAERCWWR